MGDTLRYRLFRLAALAAAASGLTPATAAAPAPAKAAEPAPQADDPAKFFLFHLDGVSFETARADYGYCIDQSWRILSLRDKVPSGGGLLGAIINSRMGEIDRFRMRNAAMRKCMGLMGYHRYRIAEADWDTLVKKGDIVVANNNQVDLEVLDRLARYASGPTPATERLDP
jgi:hypothetical protein